MGVFIWHQWAQVVAIFASVYTVWAGIWGIFFRKFFWDFVNGTLEPGPGPTSTSLRTIPCTDAIPCGIMPAPSDAIFINIIVNAPVVQIICILLGMFHLALELIPQMRKTALYRNFVVRIVTLFFQTLLAVLFYQGTNGALYSFVAWIGYTVAQMKGEEWEEMQENRGRGGGSKA